MAAFVALHLSASWASAQDVVPDASPLVVAAEEDCAADRLAMCRQRAELALPLLPERSAIRVRAQALLALTADAAPATALDVEAVLAPLMTAIELEVTDGRAAAAAHLAALRALAPADSAMLARAVALVGSPVPVPLPEEVVVPAGYALPAPAGPTEGAVPPPPAGGAEDDEDPSAQPRDEAPLGYHRRDDGELVDFYISSATAGAAFTTYFLAETGLANEIAPTDPIRVYLSAPVIGAGLFLLVPFGLDQIDHGMPACAPGAISMGLRFGAGLAGLSIGAAGGLAANDVGHVMFGTTLASATLFGAVAYLTLPHPSQVQMIQNTGLWGGAFGAFLTLAILPNVRGPDGARFGFGTVLAGLGTGILTGSVLSGLGLQLSSGRSWLGSLGVVSGAGAGALVYLLIGGLGGNFDPTIAGVSCLLGSAGGLALALALTEGMPGAVRFDDVTVSASMAPTEGGGIATIAGTF